MFDAGVFDSSDYVASSFVTSSGRMREIAEVYVTRGEYYDIDYPGGIEQLVRDYRDGKFDEEVCMVRMVLPGVTVENFEAGVAADAAYEMLAGLRDLKERLVSGESVEGVDAAMREDVLALDMDNLDVSVLGTESGKVVLEVR